MFALKNYKLENFFNLILCCLPISFVIGNLIINLNIFILIILGLIIIKDKNLSIKFDFISITLTLYFFVTFVSTIINNQIPGVEIYFKTALYFRFLVLFFIFRALSENNFINFDNFFKICFLFTFFIALDILFQYLVGTNFLGFRPLYNEFYTGVFNAEKIAGGYLQEFFLLSFLFLILLREEKYFGLLFITFIVVSFLAIAISGNRMPFILVSFSLILLFYFIKSFRIKIIFSIILFSLIFSYVLKTNEKINQNYLNMIHKVLVNGKIFTFGGTTYDPKKQYLKDSRKDDIIPENLKKYSFFAEGSSSSNHGYIYLLTLRSFNENKVIGNGFKSSRRYCFNEDIVEGKWCLSHPHNYHLEVLNDSGLLGYLFLSISILALFINSYKNLRTRKNLVTLVFTIALFIEIWPIKSTGSIYGTWNGSISWLILALCTQNLKKEI